MSEEGYQDKDRSAVILILKDTSEDRSEGIQYLPQISGPSLVAAPSLGSDKTSAESKDAGEAPSGHLCRTVEKEEEPRPDPNGTADNKSAYSNDSDDIVDETIYKAAKEFEVEAKDFAAVMNEAEEESEAESELGSKEDRDDDKAAESDKHVDDIMLPFLHHCS